jgi:hypothetical protein
LVVTKHVVNDNGGTKTASDFSLTVTGTNVAPSATFAGSESGTTVTLNAGGYSIDEAAVTGYAKSLGANCTGTIANGQTKTCTITNDDIAPTLLVKKHVVNSSGGTATANQWTLVVASSDGGTGTGTAAGAESGTLYTLLAGKTYNVTENGGPSGYAGSASAACTTLVPTVGGTYTCTITNDDIAPTLTVVKHVVNNNGGTAIAANWILTLSSPNGGSGTGSAAGSESGTLYGNLTAGKTYNVSESGGAPYYVGSFGSSCQSLVPALATNYTCTVVNDDPYVFIGLLDPYDPDFANKSYKAGSTIPLKWKYSDGATVIDSHTAMPLVTIFSVGSCGSDDGSAPLVVDAPGASGLTYDAGGKTWHFNWQTPRVSQPTCYVIRITNSTPGYPVSPDFYIKLKK